MATHHILIAESRPNLRHSLSLTLKQADYRISLAENTEEAMTLAAALHNTQNPIDLLIVDLDSASPEACRAFRRILFTSALDLPYLALAEEINDQTGDALKRHGCLACLIKPFEPDTLLRSVHDALTRIAVKNGQQPGRKPDKTYPESAANQPG